MAAVTEADWSCPICCDLAFRPAVNACGHVFCFWYVAACDWLDEAMIEGVIKHMPVQCAWVAGSSGRSCLQPHSAPPIERVQSLETCAWCLRGPATTVLDQLLTCSSCCRCAPVCAGACTRRCRRMHPATAPSAVPHSPTSRPPAASCTPCCGATSPRRTRSARGRHRVRRAACWAATLSERVRTPLPCCSAQGSAKPGPRGCAAAHALQACLPAHCSLSYWFV